MITVIRFRGGEEGAFTRVRGQIKVINSLSTSDLEFKVTKVTYYDRKANSGPHALRTRLLTELALLSGNVTVLYPRVPLEKCSPELSVEKSQGASHF